MHVSTQGQYILGIDAGTTAMKAVLFDHEGRASGQSIHEYQLMIPAPDRAELELECYWTACCHCTRSLLAQAGVDSRQVTALAISSQGETLLVIDETGRPLYPAIVWLDNRSQAEADEVSAHFGAERVFQVTGQPEITPTWPATKMLWLRRHQPQVFEQAHKFLLLEDYLLFRLTGRFVANPSLLSSSLLFDIRRKTWWTDMLDFVGVTPDRLPEIRDSGKTVGELTAEAARETGLWEGTVAATGGMDQALAALGAGNTRPGLITENTGGALAIVATLEEPVFDPQGDIPCHCHALPDTYYLLPWGQTAGMTLRWFRDVFGVEERVNAARAGADAYDLLTEAAAGVAPGSEGLVVLPHLMGAACPEFNPAARGVWFGIGLHHTRAHFVRAILEAVAYMLRRNVENLEALGVAVDEIRALGGGARSALWNQIKADVLGVPVVTLTNEEQACLGAAMLAGTAVGLYPSVEEAAQRLVKVAGRWEPNPALKSVYDHGYELYGRLYDSLEELFTLARIKDVTAQIEPTG
jgi:sugar (pentulose or hexulose) kinase